MTHPVDIYVGQKLREQRCKLKLTQNDLAEAVGVRFQQIQKYENGSNRISASRLWEVSEVLEVPVSYFFDGFHEHAASKSGKEPPRAMASA